MGLLTPHASDNHAGITEGETVLYQISLAVDLSHKKEFQEDVGNSGIKIRKKWKGKGKKMKKGYNTETICAGDLQKTSTGSTGNSC